MLKKIVMTMLSLLLILNLCVQPYMAAQAEDSTEVKATTIWPMEENQGFWMTQEYASDESLRNRLDTDSIKLLNSEIVDGAWRASLSSYASGKSASSSFVFVNGGAIIDLAKDPYLYYDFTMQDVMWSFTIQIGLADAYAWDISVPLQKLICEEEGTAYLTNTKQYGVRGHYQGKINLNDAIRESGKNNFYNLDLTNQKVRVLSGGITYYQGYENAVMEIRHLGFNTPKYSYKNVQLPLEVVEKTLYEAKNVSVTGTFQEGDEIVNLLDPYYEWKTNISPTDMAAVGGDTQYLSLDMTDGKFAMQATGQSIKDKAYIKGAVVGWPKLTATLPVAKHFEVHNSYLVYDFTAEASWDVLLTLNTHWTFSLREVLESITDDNSIDVGTCIRDGRAYGKPGTYKGVLNLEEILYYYQSGKLPICPKKTGMLSAVTFIYENSESDDTSLVNTFNTLKIVREDTATEELSTINDTETYTKGVYKPDGYEQPVYPEEEPRQNSANVSETAESDENIRKYIAYIGGTSVVLVVIVVVLVVLTVKKRKRKAQKEVKTDE